MARREKQSYTTLPPFNASRPLRVVRVDEHALGVVDESRSGVWVEFALNSIRMDVESLHPIHLPEIPVDYGRWDVKPIGGVSKTVRREGLLRCTSQPDPVVLFALRAPVAQSESIGELGRVVQTESHDELGTITELWAEGSDVARLAARVARTGARPQLENESLNMRRRLGIERLDRIESDDEVLDRGDGPRRGCENWRFPWIPRHWKVPVSWNRMVDNVLAEPAVDVSSLPRPLRQHVARAMLERGMHLPVGCEWQLAPAPPEEASRVIDAPPDELVCALGLGERVFSPERVRDWWPCEPLDPRASYVRGWDDEWYVAKDPTWNLRRYVPKSREVSAALSEDQSKQLLTAFYCLDVEGLEDALQAHACELLLFHYLKETGYMGRWLGKYKQDALNVGNGDGYRVFRNLPQYAPDRLSTRVLNRLMSSDGRLLTRGSKGSRSKYRTDKPLYVPSRRLVRTAMDEWGMTR